MIAGITIPFILLALYMISKQFPDKTFYQINEMIFTKWGGKVFSFLFVFYYCTIAGLIILLFGRMISLWVLPNTPFWVLAACMVVVGWYLSNGGLLVLGRFYTMVSVLLVFLIGLMLLSFEEAHFMYIFPMGEAGFSAILKGSTKALLSFFGFFVALIVFPKVEGKPWDKFKTMLQSHFFVFFFYMLTVLISYTFFSTKELALVPEPLLYMLKSFELPFVARIDLFFISVWFVSVATSYTTYLYIASLGLKQIFGTKSIKPFTFLISMCVLVFSFFIGYDMRKMDVYTQYVENTGYALSYFIPFVILIVVAIYTKVQKGRGGMAS